MDFIEMFGPFNSFIYHNDSPISDSSILCFCIFCEKKFKIMEACYPTVPICDSCREAVLHLLAREKEMMRKEADHEEK